MSSPRVWLIPKATEIAGLSAVKREMRSIGDSARPRDSGKPQEIAPVIVFLASDGAAWLTGEANQRFRGPALRLRYFAIRRPSKKT